MKKLRLYTVSLGTLQGAYAVEYVIAYNAREAFLAARDRVAAAAGTNRERWYLSSCKRWPGILGTAVCLLPQGGAIIDGHLTPAPDTKAQLLRKHRLYKKYGQVRG